MNRSADNGYWQRRTELEEELLSRLASHRAAPDPAPSDSGDAATGPVPATSAQARLYFLSQLEPADRSYRIPVVLRLRGKADTTPVVVAAVEAVVRRHDSLRSVLRSDNGTVWLDVQPYSQRFAVQVVQPIAPAAGWTAEAVVGLAETVVQPSFDLEAGPLFRATLFRLDADDHLLACCMHHAVADAWSVGLFYTDLAAAYRSHRDRGVATLPSLAVSYRDYAVERHRWLAAGGADANLAYWRDRLIDAPAAVSLPTDHRRPELRRHRGARVSATLGAAQWAGVEQLAVSARTTSANVLLAAFAAVLHRWSGDSEMVIGAPVAGRHRLAWEPTVGLFASTLPLRLSFDDAPTMRGLLERVHRETLAALEHSAVPLERLVAELPRHRDLARTPVYQVMFAMQSVPAVAAGGFGELTVEWVRVPTGGAKLDLTLHAAPATDGLLLSLEYDLDLYRPDTACALLDQVIAATRSAVANPETQVGRLRLTGPGTSVPSPPLHREVPDACVPGLIAERIAADGAAIALRLGAAELTYGQLGELVAGLAARLDRELREGNASEALVAVVLPRSFELIAALLAVHHRGAAYLPLDPRWPAERLLRILRESRPQVVLATRSLAERCRALAGPRWFAVDGPAPPDLDVPPRAPVALDDAAYVIYTSGSTGTPKGVVVEHRGLANHILWAAEEFGIDDGLGSLLQASVGYDLPVPNLYVPLVAGRTLVLSDPDAPDALAGAAELAGGGFSFIKITPSHLRSLRAELPPHALASAASRLVLAGEDLRGDDLRDLARSAPEQIVINEYGPTEVSVACTTYTGTAAELAALDRVPIGAPLWNMSVYLLDPLLRPVPPGVLGEVYVGGIGVARGYRDRPLLTAECFLPDPYADRPGARMYRTGDLARYRPDRMVVFAGRVDHQVKIRGVRVELAEIEEVLRAYPDVFDAAVIPVPGTTTELHAYVAAGRALDRTELALWLRRRLPEQMLPSRVSLVDRLPLTGNGKVDRIALARQQPDPPAGLEPEPAAPDARGGAPRTPTEAALARLWTENLSLSAVWRDDDYFTLGGHSLRAVELVNNVTEAFGVRLPLRLVFEAPRLADLAREIERLVHMRVQQMSATDVARHLATGGTNERSA